MPESAGIHHLKLAVSDLSLSEAFYRRVFDARRMPEADHRDASGHLYAIICSVPGLGALLELRLNAAAAERQAGFDPVTISVEDLEELDALDPQAGCASSSALRSPGRAPGVAHRVR